MNTIKMIEAKDLSEFVGQIIDIFEDFLAEKNIDISNEEKEEDSDAAILYGTDYGELQTKIEDTLINWEITKGHYEVPNES